MAYRSFVQRFGQRVRALRLQRGLSQEALPDAARLHRTHVSLIERGQRAVRLETVAALSVALGVGRTLAKYRQGESLVWRDAGALVATIGFACNAIGIKCTPFGPTGEPFLSRLLGGPGAPKGVGGCVIGR